jgi:hypothetical protein
LCLTVFVVESRTVDKVPGCLILRDACLEGSHPGRHVFQWGGVEGFVASAVIPK